MISVVMPVYNEGGFIFTNLGKTCEVMRLVGEFEIIPVNDGSSDHSREEIDRAAAILSEIRPLHISHSGKGEALRQGTLHAKGEWVIFMDADLDLPPEQILFFVAIQKARKADAVIGSKMHPDSTVDYPFHRRLYSWGYYCLIKILFGLPLRDTQTGLKLFKREILLRALEKTTLKGFAFDLELLTHLSRLQVRMVEAPVVVDFKIKFGGIGGKEVARILGDTLRTWRHLSR
jgi:glycosyltransferase involved in cell wall biosynthesis